ncbi:MAG: terpene cyclase/mutase family protein [Pirellulales bacterium]|nr:terpene cyclase/mutase family protein [Pirellulales bacterium]
MSTANDSESSVDLTGGKEHVVPANSGKPTPTISGSTTSRPETPASKASKSSSPPQATPKAKAPAGHRASAKSVPGPGSANVPAKTLRAVSAQPPEAPSRDPDDGADNDEESLTALGGWLSTVPAWLVSMVFHIAMLLVLALLTLRTASDKQTEISLHRGNDPTRLESTDDIPMLDDLAQTDDPLESVKLETSDTSPVPVEFQDLQLAATNRPLVDLSQVTATHNAAATLSAINGAALMSRGPDARGALLRGGGGTPESEEAVRLALEWLAQHQYPDGSWSFDHQHAQRCNKRCSAPGIIGTRQPDAPNAATALGLLPFLGAGFTHKEGRYKGVVDKGLKYLIRSQKRTRDGGSWHESAGTMYSHGLCAIAICEAYAMTEDPTLREPAQEAIRYIQSAQDRSGGGWRYYPGMAGDTSVVGWQIMALKSAQMAYLEVNPQTIVLAESFLDSVSRQSGSIYGYQQPGGTKTLTSVGLLCRMFMGWKQDHPALVRGVQFLSETGPDVISNDVYYNYYATQVLRHYDGPMWTKWNEELREHLIKTQDRRGHARGSWYSDGSYNKTGGRHYTTALSCMILEVYYRHMPLYKEASNLGFDVGDAFKLDPESDNDGK